MLIDLDIAAQAARRWKARTAQREQTRSKLDEGGSAAAETPKRLRLRVERLGAAATRAMAASAASLATGSMQHASLSLVQTVGLERVTGKPDFLGINFLELALAVASFVGRVHIRSSPARTAGFGTGFMVSPQLLLTNHPVLRSKADALHIKIEFDYPYDRNGRLLPVVTYGLQPDENFTHYVADTEPGSSGAPVYNDQREVVRDTKNRTLDAAQRRLRDELLDAAPPHPFEAARLTAQASAAQLPAAGGTTTPAPTAASVPPGSVTWTIALQVTVRVGAAALPVEPQPIKHRAAEKKPPGQPAAPLLAATSAEPPAALRAALQELESASTRPCYDEARDAAARVRYCAGMSPTVYPWLLNAQKLLAAPLPEAVASPALEMQAHVEVDKGGLGTFAHLFEGMLLTTPIAADAAALSADTRLKRRLPELLQVPPGDLPAMEARTAARGANDAVRARLSQRASPALQRLLGG